MVNSACYKTGTKSERDADVTAFYECVLQPPPCPPRTAAILVLSLLLPAVGCYKSPVQNRGSISGEVKLNGQPISQGSILLTPLEGTQGTASGGEIKSGRYELPLAAGAAIGWNRVELRAARKTGRLVQKPMARKGVLIDEVVEMVPPQFNSASTLKVEVKPGNNTADFEITSK
jgi:hypothetical protein